ncbi:hypothetical protein G9G54_13615 [Paenibacillus sp. EKM212P]|uniref:YopX family protein n=1 Tax=Paenibacillus sp. EKM212P TaxID=1683680 RepID=UPI0013EBA6A7|nr:YopX family protein [Paenibacillus sp. EKM212P]KAF6578309.1 hypothetical protein G9G54_13615 [Paenibacillus sp. EKM212P]
MSRPYRVWDTESKCFWQDINEAHVGCIGQLFIKPSGDFVLRQNGTIIHESMFPGRFIRQDSTGLKDRNGKEIYEGDIVEELDYSDGAYFPKERQPKKRTVVEYDIGFVYARAAYNLRGDMENGLYKGEVIGNIYETPLEDTP